MGIINSPWFHFNCALVFTISSSPSGDPWEDALEDLLGEPKPIVVLKFINVGFFDLRLLSIFFLIFEKLCPSPLRTFQLTDSNLMFIVPTKNVNKILHTMMHELDITGDGEGISYSYPIHNLKGLTLKTSDL